MDQSSLQDILLYNELLDDDLLLTVCNNSNEDEDEFEVCNLVCAATVLLERQIKNKKNTIKNYCEEFVGNYTATEFSSHFRVTKFLFQKLAENFQESKIYQKLLTAHSRANISPEKHILIFLWFAGHETSSFRDVADRFDVCLSSLYEVITRVMMFLSSMATQVINFPSEQEKSVTKRFYSIHKSFPNVVGSIDSSHIRIDRPNENDRPTDYFNREDYHSIVLQGVCNEKLKFLDVCIGYPGSVHDARIFRNSSLHTKLNEVCGEGEYLLGDGAYPLLTKLLTPYRDNGHLTRVQKNFNTKLSSCRVSIEQAFSLLKRRFRQLYHLKLKGPQRICHFIRACCVLHNLSIDDNLSFESEDAVNDGQPQLLICQENQNREASKIRDNISKDLVRN